MKASGSHPEDTMPHPFNDRGALWRNRPQGCHCDPMDWGNPLKIPSVCNIFLPISTAEPDLCSHCEHLRECHL